MEKNNSTHPHCQYVTTDSQQSENIQNENICEQSKQQDCELDLLDGLLSQPTEGQINHISDLQNQDLINIPDLYTSGFEDFSSVDFSDIQSLDQAEYVDISQFEREGTLEQPAVQFPDNVQYLSQNLSQNQTQDQSQPEDPATFGHVLTNEDLHDFDLTLLQDFQDADAILDSNNSYATNVHQTGGCSNGNGYITENDNLTVDHPYGCHEYTLTQDQSLSGPDLQATSSYKRPIQDCTDEQYSLDNKIQRTEETFQLSNQVTCHEDETQGGTSTHFTKAGPVQGQYLYPIPPSAHPLVPTSYTVPYQGQTVYTIPPQMHTPAVDTDNHAVAQTSTGQTQDYTIIMNHPASVRNRSCLVCGDIARGKNYGAYSCDSCKGFFGRTVKKKLKYACREDRECPIDKKRRTRCQYCRYVKCVAVGMKYEETPTTNKSTNSTVASGSSPVSHVMSEMTIERLLEANMELNPTVQLVEDKRSETYISNILQGADKQLTKLVNWAKKVPYFNDITTEDQVTLLRSAWTEILIIGFCHRSMQVEEGILLSTGVCVKKDTAEKAGCGALFDRIQDELISCMKRMRMDTAELACLRCIMVYNSRALGIDNADRIEQLHDQVHDILEKYCLDIYPDQPGRYSKIILRLPALRSIKLKCMETMFFMKSCGAPAHDSVMMAMIDKTDENEVE